MDAAAAINVLFPLVARPCHRVSIYAV